MQQAQTGSIPCVACPSSDGAHPWTGLALGTDGNLYGTAQGGNHNAGALFKITPTGTESVLHDFCSSSGCADGFFPQTPILQHTNGKFYGSVESGGAGGLNGGVFYSLDMGLPPFAGLVTWQGASGKTVEILGPAKEEEFTLGDRYGFQ